jgi:general secretion pathway protein I
MTRRDNGSVLIETMVASVIVALMLAAMYSAIADSARANAHATEKRTALMIAQSELAAVGSALPLSPGVTGGVQGPYAWRVEIEPYAAAEGPSDAGPLWEVTVSVRTTDSKADLVTLRSLEIGPVS